ncbi:MAG: hypothetical protein HN509_13850 [Halobacteriovoraceae bacterium]|nr:hypothetical protein [Halobacteriovoraceae bacterium]
MRSLLWPLFVLSFLFPAWGEGPSIIQKIAAPDLISLHKSLSFSPDPISVDYLEKTIALTSEYLKERHDLKDSERRQLTSSLQKIERFHQVSNKLTNCGDKDDRGLQMAASLGAAQVHHCEFYEGVPEVPAAITQTLPALQDHAMAPILLEQSMLDTLTSQLGMKRLLPFAQKETAEQICQKAKSSFPDLKGKIEELCLEKKNDNAQSFKSAAAVNSELSQRADKINTVLKKLNDSINLKLREYQKKNPDSSIVEWSKEVMRLGPTDPLYREYLELYHKQTADELGRLTNLPPLDKRFGKAMEFDFKKITRPINGVNGVTIQLPIHAGTNYMFSASKPKIDLDEDDIEELVETITDHQKDVNEELLDLSDSDDAHDKIKSLLKINPFSIGSVLMNYPNSSDYICGLMGEIMKSDHRKKIVFKTIDYVALGVGLLPVVGWGTGLLIKGGSVAARSLAFAGRLASGTVVSALVAGSTAVEGINVYNKLGHFNTMVLGLRQTMLESDEIPAELKAEYDRAQGELNDAIFEAKVLGALGGLSLGVMGRNLAQLARDMDPKKMAQAMSNMAANLRAKSKAYQFPTSVVVRNSRLSKPLRTIVAKTLIPDLSPQQVKVVLRAHAYPPGKKVAVYQFSPEEIAEKYRILLRGGIDPDDARILVRGGVTGGYQEGTSFQRALSYLPGVGASPTKIGLSEIFTRLSKGNLEKHLSQNNLKRISDSLEKLKVGNYTKGLNTLEDVPVDVVQFLKRAITDQRVGGLRGLTENQRKMVAHARGIFGDVEGSLARLKYLEGTHIAKGEDGIRYFTGVPKQLRAKPGHTLVYKGTAYPDGPIISKSQVGVDIKDVPRGDQHFLSYGDGLLHSKIGGANLPDGISVTTHAPSATSYADNVVAYQVPNEVFEKLPAGDPTLAEKVFKFMIPDEYRVLTTDKDTMIRYNQFFHPSKNN